MFKLNNLASLHYNWLSDMNWNKANFLESMALICSEFGESSAECFDIEPTEDFKYELADIALRTIGILKRFNQDIDESIQINYPSIKTFLSALNFYSRSNLECLSIISIKTSLAINECRSDHPSDKFYPLLIQTLICVIELSKKNNIDLEKALSEKININLSRGTRGRKI